MWVSLCVVNCRWKNCLVLPPLGQRPSACVGCRCSHPITHTLDIRTRVIDVLRSRSLFACDVVGSGPLCFVLISRISNKELPKWTRQSQFCKYFVGFLAIFYLCNGHYAYIDMMPGIIDASDTFGTMSTRAL